ncbi:ribonuclease HI, partial [Trypanosoma cruzi]
AVRDAASLAVAKRLSLSMALQGENVFYCVMGGARMFPTQRTLVSAFQGSSTAGLLAPVEAAVWPFLSVRGHGWKRDRPCRRDRAGAGDHPFRGRNETGGFVGVSPSLLYKEYGSRGIGWAGLRGRAATNGCRRRRTHGGLGSQHPIRLPWRYHCAAVH